jgi:hypothetical protein
MWDKYYEIGTRMRDDSEYTIVTILGAIMLGFPTVLISMAITVGAVLAVFAIGAGLHLMGVPVPLAVIITFGIVVIGGLSMCVGLDV